MREDAFEYEGLRVVCQPDVYRPSDDTLLLLKAVEARAPGRLLEVGAGTGLVSIAAARAGHRVTSTDLHRGALRLAGRNAQKNNVRIERAQVDLLLGVRPERFDLVAFNPPYLPTDAAERVPGPLNDAFDGGPTGGKVLERFLAQLPAQAPPVLVVVSSLQKIPSFGANRRTRTVSSARFDDETIRLELVESREESRITQKD